MEKQDINQLIDKYKTVRKDWIAVNKTYKDLTQQYYNTTGINPEKRKKARNISLITTFSSLFASGILGLFFGPNNLLAYNLCGAIFVLIFLPSVCSYFFLDTSISNINIRLKRQAMEKTNLLNNYPKRTFIQASSFNSFKRLKIRLKTLAKRLKRNNIDIISINKEIEQEIQKENKSNQSVSGLKVIITKQTDKKDVNKKLSNSDIKSKDNNEKQNDKFVK